MMSMPTSAGWGGTSSWAMNGPTSIRPTPRPGQQPRRWASRVSPTTQSATAKTHGCRPAPMMSMPTPAGWGGTSSWAMNGPTSTRPTPRPRRQPRRWASRVSPTTQSATAKTHGCRPAPMMSMPTPAGWGGTSSWAINGQTYSRPTPRPGQQPRRWASRVSPTTQSATAKTRGCLPAPIRFMPTPAG